MNLDTSQKTAICFAANNDLSLVTGGAGTGKTTIIKEITNRIGGREQYTLCAPTGKAAARLREATGLHASTIHSMLSYNGSRFTAGSLAGQTIIVDEGSMLSSDLLAAIARRRPHRIILVGDSSQLHPVGAGAPFHDIIKIQPSVVVELEHCYRSAEAVCQAGNLVRAGQYPGTDIKSSNEHYQHIISQNPAAAEATIVDMAKRGELDFEKDIVLCPKNGKLDELENFAPCTRKSLNKKIVDAVNPHVDDAKWKIGDRIISTKNFHKEDIWNGTTGTITAIDSEREIWIRPDMPVFNSEMNEYTDRVKFGKPMIAAMEHAYALSVHKSQGSQYRKVIFCCFSRDAYRMINRALIYTAITRAKNEVMVIGDKEAFTMGLQQQEHKTTVLQELAREAACQGQ